MLYMKFTLFRLQDLPAACSSGGNAVLQDANSVDLGVLPLLDCANTPGSDSAEQTWYTCNYCGRGNATASGISNGRTRIGRDCGGIGHDRVHWLHQR